MALQRINWTQIDTVPPSGSVIGLGSQIYPLERIYSNHLDILGSINVGEGGITGSLFGTASYSTQAKNSYTASYVLNAISSSFATSASFSTTSSYAIFFNTGSLLTTSSFNIYTGSTSSNFAGTSSYTQLAKFALTASYVKNAQTASYVLNAQTSSYVLNAQTSSYVLNAQTASYVKNAQTASYVLNAQTSSYVLNAQTASYVENAQTSSYVLNAQTSSYVLNAQTASYVENAQTASYVENAQTASYVENAQTASYVENAQTASYVENAQTSSYVENAQTASYVENAQTASYVENAQTASYVLNSQTASYVENAVSASFSQTSSYVLNSVSASYIKNAVSSSFSSYAKIAEFALNGGGGGGGGTPGGAYNQIQYNFNGFFDGVPTLIYDGETLSATGSFSGSFEGTSSFSLSSLFSQTSSYVENAQTASYVENAQTASYVENAQTASYVENAQTASYVENAQTASYVENAQTASYVKNAQTASYVENAQTASYVENAQTASYVENAQTASYVENAQTASYVENAQTASYVENAQTASYVENAQTASYVLNAVSSSFAQTSSFLLNNIDFSGSLRLYVSPMGSDTNDGTQSTKPFKTIKAAVASISNGPINPQVNKLYTVFVSTGDYREDNPIIVPPGVAIVGDNLKTVRLTADNPTKDYFHCYGATYFYGLRFLDMRHPSFTFSFPCSTATGTVDLNGQVSSLSIIHSATGYTPNRSNLDIGIIIEAPDSINSTSRSATATVDTDNDGVITNINIVDAGTGYTTNEKFHISIPVPVAQQPFITASPYVQNCSSITGPFTLLGDKVSVRVPLPYNINNISGSSIDPQGAGGGIRIDGNLVNSGSPLQSFVADSFTQVNQGGPGHLVINNGYAQFVSCFTTFCTYGFKVAAGGYANISNSVCDFGNVGLISKKNYPIAYNTATVAVEKTSKVSSLVLSNQGKGYTGTTVNLTITGGGGTGATAQGKILDGSITELVLLTNGTGYTSVPTLVFPPPTSGATLIQATGSTVLSGVVDFIMNLSDGVRGVDISSNMSFNGVDYLVTGIVPITGLTGQTKSITVYPAPISITTGYTATFKQLSNISTGGLVMEYVGAGVTYNALPKFGGIPNSGKEVVEISPGKVFYATIDNIGNLKIGKYFKVNQLTGEVTIASDKFNLSGLSSIGPFRRNGADAGVALNEVSDNTELRNSIGILGASDTVPTQNAVLNYAAPLNRVLTINDIPYNLSTNQTIYAGSKSIIKISTNETLLTRKETDYIYLVSGTNTVTLPSASGNTNTYTIKRIGTGVVTVATTASQTIDGSTSITINVQYGSITVVSDNIGVNSNWYII